MNKLLRIVQIHRVLVRHGLDRLLTSIPQARGITLLLWLTPWVFLHPKRNQGSEAQRIREALVELGPIFVKFGQMLSTRRDLLSDDVADELAKLQDRVPPFSVQHVHDILLKAYGEPAHEIFAEFDDMPLASASIAQVHVATLKEGQDVVVKVLRPDVEKRIRTDVAVMQMMANAAERYSSEARRLHVVDVVKEYEKTIIDELDLVREAGNGSQLRRNFEDSEVLYIPEIYWPYATEKAIVMERIHGIPVTDVDTLNAEGVNLRLLAERGVEIFFSQVFRDNFFHADMHPGNIFVRPGRPNSPQYMCVDFGIVGSLSPADKRYLAENLLAFFRRDYYRVAQLHIESGWLHADTRIDEFEAAVRSACEPIFERPLAEISFGTLLLRLFKISQRYGYEVQPQLVLLQKTLLNIEGLGRQLYPQLDLWETAQPFLEKWMKEQVGPVDMLNNLRATAPEWLGDVPEIPAVLKRLVAQISDGKLKVELQPGEMQQFQQQLQQQQKRSSSLTVAAALALAGLAYMLARAAHGDVATMGDGGTYRLADYVPWGLGGGAILGLLWSNRG